MVESGKADFAHQTAAERCSEASDDKAPHVKHADHSRPRSDRQQHCETLQPSCCMQHWWWRRVKAYNTFTFHRLIVYCSPRCDEKWKDCVVRSSWLVKPQVSLQTGSVTLPILSFFVHLYLNEHTRTTAAPCKAVFVLNINWHLQRSSDLNWTFAITWRLQ